MMSTLASPSVCVIDDEPSDYEPILNALNSLFIPCIHIRGESSEGLPAQPFSGVRLVFTDLHLNSSTGKDAASHTANVFTRVVSAQAAPVIVVIWSKYANDPVNTGDSLDDEENEASLFKRELKAAQPDLDNRVVFLEMAKPKLRDRNDENSFQDFIKAEIENILSNKAAIDAMLTWESIAKEAAMAVSAGLWQVAYRDNSCADQKYTRITQTLQLLVKAHDEHEYASEKSLCAALGQLLIDQLDHSDVSELSRHRNWLAPQTHSSKDKSSKNKSSIDKLLAAKLNGFLLTMSASEAESLVPGTIYGDVSDEQFLEYFGSPFAEFSHDAFEGKNDIEKRRPVLIDVSPLCDVAQGKRRTALLIAGVVASSDSRPKNQGAFSALPDLELRNEIELQSGMKSSKIKSISIVFCSRYKIALIGKRRPDWLKPLFRLRETPTTSIRNWHASQSARVGYVSID